MTNPDKVFWPREGYTKGDLVEYYRSIARWMLPYLKDRPVMLTRYPDGIDGKSFYQKDAPAFAPPWIRTEKIYSARLAARHFIFHPGQRGRARLHGQSRGDHDSYLVVAHPHLENPDWLLFDIDPKGSTTADAVRGTARETAEAAARGRARTVSQDLGADGTSRDGRAWSRNIPTSRRAMFSEIVARAGGDARIPDLATIKRNPRSAHGQGLYRLPAARTRQDYRGAILGAADSGRARFRADDVEGTEADPRSAVFNIKTMPARMAKLKRDPFLEAIEKHASLEEALPHLEAILNDTTASRSGSRSENVSTVTK